MLLQTPKKSPCFNVAKWKCIEASASRDRGSGTGIMLGEGEGFSVAHACKGEGVDLGERWDVKVERQYLTTSPFLLAIAEL